MGCDIHLHVERRIPGLGWTYLGEPHELSRRNYAVFAILANVRNARGSAGIPTGSGFVPIAEPRGLPADATETVRTASEDWGVEGHSRSWLILREVLDYDYHQITTHQGVLDFAAFQRFDRYREACEPDGEFPSPQSWSRGVHEGDTLIPDTQARAMTEAPPRTYVRTTWKRRYLDDVKGFLAELVPYIKYGLDDVRLVFWFDN